MIQPGAVRSEAEIREAVDRVFRSPDYSRSWQEVVFATLVSVYETVRAAIARAAREHPVIFWASLGLLVALVVIVFWRGAWLARRRAELLARVQGRKAGGSGSGDRSDSWKLAQSLAAQGHYAEAAHALYRHLLDWLAATENVQLHHSKTVGDYARELRGRASRVYSTYRAFARSYEVVVYGSGSCDRDRFEQLLQLADAVTDPHG